MKTHPLESYWAVLNAPIACSEPAESVQGLSPTVEGVAGYDFNRDRQDSDYNANNGMPVTSLSDAQAVQQGAQNLHYTHFMKPKFARAPIKEAGRVAYLGESSNLSLLVHDTIRSRDRELDCRSWTILKSTFCTRGELSCFLHGLSAMSSSNRSSNGLLQWFPLSTRAGSWRTIGTTKILLLCFCCRLSSSPVRESVQILNSWMPTAQRHLLP